MVDPAEPKEDETEVFAACAFDIDEDGYEVDANSVEPKEE